MINAKAIARIAVFAAGSALVAIPTHANILVNGSFEAPPIPTGTYNIYGSISGWSGYGYGIEIQNHVAGSPCASCGDQFVELDTDRASGVYQFFSSAPGQEYDLGFVYSPRPNVSLPDNVINAYWLSIATGSHFLGTVSGDGSSLSDTSWSSHTFSFVADAPASAVVFLDGGWPSYYSGIVGGGTFDSIYSNGRGGYLDQVSVEAVPEPTTLTLLGLGLVALSVRRRRSP